MPSSKPRSTDDPSHPADHPAATASTARPDDVVRGGIGYVRQTVDPALMSWWNALPDPTRRALSAVGSGDVLAVELAARVAEAGFRCPSSVVVRADGRRERQWVAPPPLVRVIQQLRLTHTERRLT